MFLYYKIDQWFYASCQKKCIKASYLYCTQKSYDHTSLNYSIKDLLIASNTWVLRNEKDQLHVRQNAAQPFIKLKLIITLNFSLLRVYETAESYKLRPIWVPSNNLYTSHLSKCLKPIHVMITGTSQQYPVYSVPAQQLSKGFTFVLQTTFVWFSNYRYNVCSEYNFYQNFSTLWYLRMDIRLHNTI